MRNRSGCRTGLARATALAAAMAAVPIAAAPQPPPEPPAFSRAIPAFARPPGLPDPAHRVRRLRATEAPPLRARLSGAAEPLYRRAADGSYQEVRAPAWQALDSGCRAAGGDPRRRLIDLAAAEWAAFGLPVLDLSAHAATAVPRATDGGGAEIIDPARNFSVGERSTRRALRLGLMEDDPEVAATIAGYWAAVPGGGGILQRQSIVEFGDASAGWATPWSAAFVSWLACEAGLVPAGFTRSASHHDYVAAAVRARGDHAGQAYVAYDLHEAVPEPGDLLCTARAGATFASIADVRDGNSPSHALHCDLVVKADRDARRIHAIGGNVAHAVTLTVISSDATGRPLPDAVLPGAHRWFAVLKLAGPAGNHDLDSTPTVLSLFQDWRGYARATGTPTPAPLRPGGTGDPADDAAATPAATPD